ncbi:MAG: PD-(D/E)XK nuclease family protein [Planctomycetota bacterium]
MSLRFVLGRAGTGKTRRCLEEIRSGLARAPEGPPLILLVPEQATFQMDRALLEGARVEGSIRAQVLSFQRLARRILRASGAPDLPEIREAGRHMILRRILLELEASNGLRAFRRSASRPKFVERLAGTLAELSRHGQGFAEIAARRAEAEAKGASPLLVSKLSDLERIAARFEEAIRGHVLDGDALLGLAARIAPDSRILEGAKVYVDGFAGFTPQETAMLSAIFGKAAAVEVTLCLDPDASGAAGSEVFARPLETMERLTDLARRAGVPVEPPLRLAGFPPRFLAPALAAVEAVLAGLGAGANPPGGAVSIRVARDARGEAEEAAREVLRLRRGGFRWRDIAVLARSLDPYADLLEASFASRGIPIFVDRRRPASHHPLVELLRSAVEAAVAPRTGCPLQSDAVIRAAKTGLLPLEEVGLDAEADVLENYVLAHGIEGSDWTDPAPWRGFQRRRLEDDEPSAVEKARLDAAERARRKLKPLFDLSAVLSKSPDGIPVSAACKALARFLEASGALSRVQEIALRARRAGGTEVAESHRLVHNQVLETISELDSAMGTAVLPGPSLLAILESGLEAIRLSLVPPSLDAVVAASVERSRTPEVRAAIVLGLAEGSFPASFSEDPMLSDDERAALAGLGPPLRLETSLDRLFHEPYLAYVALTRARERLVLLRAGADGEGRESREAGILRSLAERIPGLSEEAAWSARPGEAFALDAAGDATDLAALAVLAGPSAPALSDRLKAANLPAALARSLEPSAFASSADLLPHDVLRSLYRPPISFGVSALETFAACPFQHFAKSILRLEERARFRIGMPEVGTFLHAALERIARRFLAEKKSLKDAQEADIESALAEAVETLAPRIQGGAFGRSARARSLLSRLSAILREDLRILKAHAERGRFEPFGLEVSFGDPKSALPALKIPTGGKSILVRGRIDRLETAPAPDGGTLVRVVDFKTTGRSVDWGFLLEGVQVQLFAYLLAANAWGDRVGATPVHPVGALYWPLTAASKTRKEAPEDPSEEFRKGAKPKGLRPAEPEFLAAFDTDQGRDGLFAQAYKADGTPAKNAQILDAGERARLFGLVESAIRTVAEGILSGRTTPTPYLRTRERSACASCDHLSVCRFDPTAGGCYRIVPSVTFQALKIRLAESAAAEGEAP